MRGRGPSSTAEALEAKHTFKGATLQSWDPNRGPQKDTFRTNSLFEHVRSIKRAIKGYAMGKDFKFFVRTKRGT